MKTQKNTKICGKCGQRKKLTDFSENRMMRTGVSSWCKSCHAGGALTVKETQNKEAK